MIHHVFIIDARNVIVVSWRYEALNIEIDSSTIMDFAARVKGSYVPILDVIGTVKYAGAAIRQGVVVLCSETLDDDTTLELKVREVTAEFEKVLDYKVRCTEVYILSQPFVYPHYVNEFVCKIILRPFTCFQRYRWSDRDW